MLWKWKYYVKNSMKNVFFSKSNFKHRTYIEDNIAISILSAVQAVKENIWQGVNWVLSHFNFDWLSDKSPGEKAIATLPPAA